MYLLFFLSLSNLYSSSTTAPKSFADLLLTFSHKFFTIRNVHTAALFSGSISFKAARNLLLGSVSDHDGIDSKPCEGFSVFFAKKPVAITEKLGRRWVSI